jgi:putative hydrolase of the HAD superfamily
MIGPIVRPVIRPVIRAVIFDLWETLVDWPIEPSSALTERLWRATPHEREEFDRLFRNTYRQRETGPLADAYRALGVAEGSLEELIAQRRENTRAALVPREGAVETIAELRRRGYRVGMISVCSEDVPALWPETPFHGLFDSQVFSATCGHMKPDAEIYLLAAGELGVEPAECLYVGDGANDELAGAERVGMTTLLIHREGEQPVWPELQTWRGLRVTSIPQVLELVSNGSFTTNR